MCGFAGVYSSKHDVSEEVLNAMNNSLVHRGPDSHGIWIDRSNKLGLGHTRLSILDISDAGAQPMLSFNGRFEICFNGEIYNHLELRKNLIDAGHIINYKSQSDTETLLTCFEIFGIKSTIQKAVGMFAFAVYDIEKDKLILGRDRFGEKPLYYGWQKSYFYFGSELKAIRKHPAFNPKVNKEALGQYMKYSYIPAPLSIYENIFKLTPGTLLQISLKQGNNSQVQESYWSLENLAKESLAKPFSGSDDEALSELERLLRRSVKGQQLADVPLGAFLSGGIDSSLIVAIMQSQNLIPVNTFTIGFEEHSYNEANYASEVAKHLKTNHTELYIGTKEIMNVIPLLPQLYDEPFADSSQLPTYLVCKLARKHVTVSLSGDAGDELFGGYNRYLQADRFIKYPAFLRKFIAGLILKFKPSQVDSIYHLLKPFISTSMRSSNPGNHLMKIASILSCDSNWDIYQKLIETGSSNQLLVNGENNKTISKKYFDALPYYEDFTSRMMLTDTLTYLPDDILCKIDRSAMGSSLETRAPFLDHRLFEFAWMLPKNFKIRDGKGKWLLRQLLYKYVPAQIIERPKIGFGIPLDSWLRGPLREWVESLLIEKNIIAEGFFNGPEVSRIWNEHLSGRKNLQYELWNILMFQAWQKEWL